MKDKIIIVIAGPSGVGKSSVINEIMKIQSEWRLSKSVTTRPVRSEHDHLEYDFISEEQFKKKIDENYFYEYDYVYGNYYGTPSKYLNGEQITIFNVSVPGALKLMNNIAIPYISIFLFPPSIEELTRRLISRNTGDNYTTRIEAATHELKQASLFKHIIVNHDVQNTANEIFQYIISYDN